MAAEPLHIDQSSNLPPAQPTYILRGHSAQIHSVHFLRQNLRLLTGDADGWVVLWNIPIRRPVAVWRAHNATILGLGSWSDDKIITHGRDHKLSVWQTNLEDEPNFSKVLPIEDAISNRAQPWLLHSLAVNSLNFCAFAMTHEISPKRPETTEETSDAGVLVAIPGVQDGYINVTSLPNEERVATIPTPKEVKTGMVMAIGLHYSNGELTILAGYESGHAAVWQRNATKHWQTTYVHKCHSQPILSLDIAAGQKCFFTSSADAIVARHPLDGNRLETRSVQTKHAGQQTLTLRSDERIFATAGWDGRVRVYSAKSMKEMAVLKWHKEGCYALAFARIFVNESPHEEASEQEILVKRKLTVSEQRTAKAESTHWLAGGSKDGKVSLWDIY